MNKDIEIKEVKDIAIGIVPGEPDENGKTTWNVCFINLKDHAVENVLVNASGEGVLNGKEVKTSVMRYLLGTVPAKSYKKIEIVIDESVAITNRYWVSFFEGGAMLDKKYIFPPGSINSEMMTIVPLLNTAGVFLS